MGFGFGPATEMQRTFENLKRKQPSAFEKMAGYEGNTSTQLHFDKEATQKQLEEIRQKIKKDNQRSLLYKAIVFLVFGSALLYFLW